ncbi:MAG: class I SAM-dependent RNA methyltransferase [Cytophagaceae bacterium]|jgi:putative N6-adenine-specific DNA methylase|nr:class I SAM-dependent RNA methyltransferase [Cytophagaceae bacterium]
MFNPENTTTILLTCAPSTSEVLASELEHLGFEIKEKSELFVRTEGTFLDSMILNLHIRTAYRVMLLIESFEAKSADHLYNQVRALPWENWLAPDGYISVDSRTNREDIRDSRFPNLKVKDAVVDRMVEQKGRRPDSGPEFKGASIFLYWKDHDASLYWDTTGIPLFRRGYRTQINEAPLQETLAAAILLSTRWDKKSPVVNPMCGTGTLAIEAALLATQTAPGLYRKNFSFQHLVFFKQEQWDSLCKEAAQKKLPRLSFRILASDHDAGAIKAARQNAKQAGVDHLIEFSVEDFSQSTIPSDQAGIVILNPEYGMRLGMQDTLVETYQGIGDFFKKKCKGYWAYVFTGNADLGKMVGLKTKRRIPFFNGKIECRLLEFELYDGSRKASNQEAN